MHWVSIMSSPAQTGTTMSKSGGIKSLKVCAIRSISVSYLINLAANILIKKNDAIGEHSLGLLKG